MAEAAVEPEMLLLAGPNPIGDPSADVVPLDTGLDPDLSQAVRTSLTIITLLSSNLDMLYERLDEPKRRQMIRDLNRQARVLNNLVLGALELWQG